MLRRAQLRTHAPHQIALYSITSSASSKTDSEMMTASWWLQTEHPQSSCACAGSGGLVHSRARRLPARQSSAGSTFANPDDEAAVDSAGGYRHHATSCAHVELGSLGGERVFDTRARSLTLTVSDPVGQEVQTTAMLRAERAGRGSSRDF
jgi:hypothetical protein